MGRENNSAPERWKPPSLGRVCVCQTMVACENSPRGGAWRLILWEAAAWVVPFLIVAVMPAAALAAERGPWERFVRGSFVTSWFLGFLCIAVSAFLGVLVLRIMQRIERHMERWAEESVRMRESIGKLAERIDNAIERRP